MRANFVKVNNKTNKSIINPRIFAFRKMNCNELHAAIRENNFARAQKLIQQRVDVNLKNDKQKSPLEVAITSEADLDIFHLLLENGADVNLPTKCGTSPLLSALRKADDDPTKARRMVIEMLLRYGADVHFKNKHGVTPLKHAVRQKGNIKIVKLLLEYGAYEVPTSKKSNKNKDNFETSKNNVNFETSKSNIHFKSNVNFESGQINDNLENRDDFRSNKINEKAQISENLVTNDKMKIKHATPLHWAAKVDDSEVLKLFINLGLDVNAKNKANWSPLQVAMFNGKQGNVQQLLDAGADVSRIPRFLSRRMERVAQYGCRCIPNAIDFVLRHLLKLKLANLLDSKVLSILQEPENAAEYEREYTNELKKMAETFVCQERTITFSDLLKKNLHKVAVYLTLDEIIIGLSEVKLEDMFPSYEGILKNKLREASKWTPLLQKSYENVKLILSSHRVPDLALKMIFDCLSYKDLKILEAMKL